MKICVVTGSRAEYGLLRPLMRLISADSSIELQVVVTGMHLVIEYGETWRNIEEDGFVISSKIEMLLSADSSTGVGKSTGLAMMGMVTEIDRLAPDWVVLLGDRYEIFAAATACVFLKIPIAHFHGGETTEGAFDECFRHSITKMSHLHFTSSEEYRRRVIQLGEQPARVFAVGAPAFDAIAEIQLLDRKAFEDSIDFELADKNALITYHPETFANEDPVEQFEGLLNALDRFPEVGKIFTLPNSDTGGLALINRVKKYCRERGSCVCWYSSLGQLKYYSALRHVDVVIGNSSSGLIEVPEFGIPTVNIGCRQLGRLRGKTIIDCEADESHITSAIEKSLSQTLSSRCGQNPYGSSGASSKALNLLKSTNRSDLIRKKFYDVNIPLSI